MSESIPVMVPVNTTLSKDVHALLLIPETLFDQMLSTTADLMIITERGQSTVNLDNVTGGDISKKTVLIKYAVIESALLDQFPNELSRYYQRIDTNVNHGLVDMLIGIQLNSDEFRKAIENTRMDTLTDKISQSKETTTQILQNLSEQVRH